MAKTLRLVERPDSVYGFEATGFDGELTTVDMDYGTSFQDSSREWQLVVLFTCRQDGKTFWSVSLVSIDGDILTRTGLTPTDAPTRAAIEAAIGKLTRDGGWIDPIN